jgi:hypothetical protein
MTRHGPISVWSSLRSRCVQLLSPRRLVLRRHGDSELQSCDMSSTVTFYTVTDATFFPGTVALINSLRLTGHDDALVALDNGLTRSQRERLERVVSVADAPEESLAKSPLTLKPFPLLIGAKGTVVIIDSDIIVTASLAPALALASRGQICLYPDLPEEQNRWCSEWQELFSLSVSPRRQTYLNSGFVAFSVDHWPNLLEEWWDACGRIPAEQVFTAEDQPFRYGDQDALNAILMSEIPTEAQTILPYESIAFPVAQSEVLDESELKCERDCHTVAVVHHLTGPKVWSREGLYRMVMSEEWALAGRFPVGGLPRLTLSDHWSRTIRGRLPLPDPYIRLFPRVVLGPNVVLKLDLRDVPWWLRPGLRQRFALRHYRVCWAFWLVGRATRRRFRTVLGRLRRSCPET